MKRPDFSVVKSKPTSIFFPLAAVSNSKVTTRPHRPHRPRRPRRSTRRPRRPRDSPFLLVMLPCLISLRLLLGCGDVISLVVVIFVSIATRSYCHVTRVAEKDGEVLPTDSYARLA